MLNRVEIRSFRSCKHLLLDDLPSMTALVGRNAAGKSNILLAIREAADFVTGGERQLAEHCDVTLTLDDGISQYAYSLQRRTQDHPLIETLDVVDHNLGSQRFFQRSDENVDLSVGDRPKLRVPRNASAIAALHALLQEPEPAIRAIASLHAMLTTIRYYVLRPVNFDFFGVVLESKYRAWLAAYEGSGDGGDEETVPYRLWYLRTNAPEAFDEIRQILGEEGLNIVSDITATSWTPNGSGSEEAASLDQMHWLLFRPAAEGSRQHGGFLFGQLSDGTRRVITLVVSIVFDKSSLMLVEHPEDGIHRGLVYKLVGLLESYSHRTQIILATHSAAVVNELPPEAMRLVSMSDGTTIVRKMTADERASARRYLEEEGSLFEFVELIQDE